MDATLYNSREQYDHSCQQCGTDFGSNSAQSKFCSPKCRQTNHRHSKSQTVAVQQKVVEQQAVELNELKSAPVTRTQTVSQINPAWQLAQQSYENQQAHCKHLNDQTRKLERRKADLTSGSRGAAIGLGLGVASALVWMAYRYDNRRQTPLGMVFAVVSLILLIGLGLAGFEIGRSLQCMADADNVAITSELTEIAQLKSEVANRLKAEMGKLEQLRVSQNQVPKHLSITQTSLNEVRTTVEAV